MYGKVNPSKTTSINSQLSFSNIQHTEDTLHHLLNLETNFLPDVHSIDCQSEIQWYMRPFLIDFLVEAHSAFRLLPETLFLSINLLDRYCSRRFIFKRHYQLLGCTALLTAAKYADRKDRVPTLTEMHTLCRSLYDKSIFLQMESHMLQTLDWLIGHATVESFLHILISSSPTHPQLEYMTRYICEISLTYRDFVSTPPSVLARSAFALARHILGYVNPLYWSWANDYNHQTIIGLFSRLYHPSPVLIRKYSSSSLQCVAFTLEEFLRFPLITPCKLASSTGQANSSTKTTFKSALDTPSGDSNAELLCQCHHHTSSDLSCIT